MNRPVAAIDIGTNSFHMIIARGDDRGNIHIIDREKQSVRLGQGGDDFDIIQDEARDRAIAALKGYVQIARSHNALIHAVGTSAVREARNQQEFIRSVRRECGIRIHVIPGQEEARLIYLGILQATAVFDRRILMIDIGGGSTEYLIGLRGEPEFIQSLKLGAIRLTERFFPGGNVTGQGEKAARTFVRSRLESMLELMKSRSPGLNFDVAVGSSGTIRAIQELVQSLLPDSGRPSTEFTARDLERVVDVLLSADTPAERMKKTGLDAARADIIVGGAVLLHESFRLLGIERMQVSPFALREGVLYEVLFRKKKRENLNEIRRKSVQFLVRKVYGHDGTPEIARISLLILYALNRVQLAHTVDHDLLEYAAALHNIGVGIAHAGHHKHGMYIIQNTDVLLGFASREVNILAAVARYHRKASPSRSHPEFAVLSDEDRERVRLFAGILRVAIGLARSDPGSIREIEARRVDHRRLQLRLLLAKGAFRPTPDLSFAVRSAELRRELLEETLNMKLTLEVEG